jgi:LDH2 family malate/lactate/ureidoglycolate dehydrogenase
MITVGPEKLARFARDVLLKAGTTDGQASATVRAMTHASLHGIDSHGFRLLGYYAEGLVRGFVKKEPNVSIARPRKAAVLVDADGGLGHFPSFLAMEEACAIASQLGIGMAAVKNSTHFGAASAYTICASEAGYIGFLACNSGALVALHGGTAAFHGTNPISFSAPLRGKDPFLLDMATSAMSWNKMLEHREEFGDLPEGVLLGQHGDSSDVAEDSVLAPLGGENFGYKGAGLAGMAEVLSAMLTGMNLSFEEDGKEAGPSKLGHFMLAIDPKTFIGREAFEERLTSYLGAIASTATENSRVYAAGGPEWEARADRMERGIPVTPTAQKEMAAAGERFGIPFPS